MREGQQKVVSFLGAVSGRKDFLISRHKFLLIVLHQIWKENTLMQKKKKKFTLTGLLKKNSDKCAYRCFDIRGLF